MIRIFGRKLTPNFTKKLFSITRGAPTGEISRLAREVVLAVKSTKIDHFRDFNAPDPNKPRHKVMEAVK